MSPIMTRHSNDELFEIKNTTKALSRDMVSLRKIIDDLTMQVNEKDAEIIKLNMHLGDEKKRYQNLYRK